MLESEEGRKGYLVYPTSKNHSSSQKGRKASLKGNGRRIDYMLYTEEGLYLEWKVVSFRADKKSHNSHNKLLWMALQPVLLGVKFILQ